MSAQTELAAVPPKETALQVFQVTNGLDPYLQKIREEIDSFVPDVTSIKGRKAIASIAYKVAQSKSALDGIGKDLVAELKEIPKKIDAERKRMRDTLDAWQEEVRRPLNEWQAAEDARVDKHNDAIAHMKLNAEALDGITTEDLTDRIAKVEAVAMGEQWEEFEPEAIRAQNQSLKTLREALGKRQQYEAEQAELVRLRAEADAREKKDREDRIAREAAEKATREAEEKAQRERDAEAQRISSEKDAAEKRELELRLKTEQAERQAMQANLDRIAAEERAEDERNQATIRQQRAVEQARAYELARQKAAADEIIRQQKARQADMAHKSKVLGEAKQAIMSMNVSEELAKAIVLKIARGEVPNITINF